MFSVFFPVLHPNLYLYKPSNLCLCSLIVTFQGLSQIPFTSVNCFLSFKNTFFSCYSILWWVFAVKCNVCCLDYKILEVTDCPYIHVSPSVFYVKWSLVIEGMWWLVMRKMTSWHNGVCRGKFPLQRMWENLSDRKLWCLHIPVPTSFPRS